MPDEPFDEDFFKRFFRRLGKFDNEFKRMEDVFNVDFRDFERTPGVAGFKIEIKDRGRGKPEVKVTRISGPQQKVPVDIPIRKTLKPRVVRPISKTLETNVGKIERPDEVILTMQASGIKKDDIELRPLGNTLEVIARKTSGEAYFAVFELPSDAVVVGRSIELKRGMLIITIPRRRHVP